METKYKLSYTSNNVQKIYETVIFIFIMHLIYNVVISIIVIIYIEMPIYIGLTIIKSNVLTCFDNSKITGAFPTKSGALRLYCWSIATSRLEHCNFAIGAL